MPGPPPAPPGAAPRPVVPAGDGMFYVRGGLAGMSFQFEELLAGAAALEGVVRELEPVEREARAVRLALAGYTSETHSGGAAATLALDEARASLAGARSELERLARDVRASHRDYEFAEARNGLLLRLGLAGTWLGSGLVTPIPDAAGREAGPGPRDAVEAEIAALPLRLSLLVGLPQPFAGTAATAGAAVAWSSPTGVGRIIRDAAGLPGLAFLKPRPVRITHSDTRVEPVDASPAGLLLRAGEVGRSPGTVEVARLGSPGQAAWAVIIPGTQNSGPDGPPEGTNPFDAAGIAEGLGFDSAETGAALRLALREAGARPGDQVVAVGYSQGGIHAMNLSQDRAFLAEYDLRYVLTAGSPVGGIEAGPGVSSLHLEHRQDWVPGSDGLPNSDTRDRVTVTLTNPVEVAPGADPGLGPGHSLENYVSGARAVTASGHPSLRASTGALAAVLGAGAASTVTRVTLRREPQPAPAGPQPRAGRAGTRGRNRARGGAGK